MQIISNTKLEITEFPTELLNKEWAYQIHGCSLETLDSRGGMSPQEIIGNIRGFSIQEIIDYPIEYAIEDIKVILEQNQE